MVKNTTVDMAFSILILLTASIFSISKGKHMDRSSHTLSCLFDQLGLDSSQEAIHLFINTHKGLDDEIAIENASFWTRSQANFLKEAVSEDADWAEVVDNLNALLR